MRLGFLTAPFPETPLTEVADWAAGAEFEVLEIACWPPATGETRR
jgi:sugar phosphate isomerase/epimerase